MAVRLVSHRGERRIAAAVSPWRSFPIAIEPGVFDGSFVHVSELMR